MKIFAGLLSLILLSTTATAAPKADPSKTLMQKVSNSFSRVPFDTPKRKVKIKLTPLEEPGCEQFGECSYLDASGVEYYFWDAEQLLVVKSVDAKQFKNKTIKALGIGTARSRDAVIANVKAFIPKAEIICREAKEAGEGEGISSCGAMLGDGWFKILFDAKNQLIMARVDAYEFT